MIFSLLIMLHLTMSASYRAHSFQKRLEPEGLSHGAIEPAVFGQHHPEAFLDMVRDMWNDQFSNELEDGLSPIWNSGAP